MYLDCFYINKRERKAVAFNRPPLKISYSLTILVPAQSDLLERLTEILRIFKFQPSLCPTL